MPYLFSQAGIGWTDSRSEKIKLVINKIKRTDSDYF
jgi:hypothetical protein